MKKAIKVDAKAALRQAKMRRDTVSATQRLVRMTVADAIDAERRKVLTILQTGVKAAKARRKAKKITKGEYAGSMAALAFVAVCLTDTGYEMETDED
jgi:hypothetical protein